jgi:hypothetical protein
MMPMDEDPWSKQNQIASQWWTIVVGWGVTLIALIAFFIVVS